MGAIEADIENTSPAIVVSRRSDPHRRDTIATITTAIVAMCVIIAATYLSALDKMGSSEVLAAWGAALTSTGATVVIRRNGK